VVPVRFRPSDLAEKCSMTKITNFLLNFSSISLPSKFGFRVGVRVCVCVCLGAWLWVRGVTGRGW